MSIKALAYYTRVIKIDIAEIFAHHFCDNAALFSEIFLFLIFVFSGDNWVVLTADTDGYVPLCFSTNASHIIKGERRSTPQR